MKRNDVLTIASLLSILLASLHLADDVIRGFEPGGMKNMTGVLLLVVWLYGTLALAERRSGYIIMLLGSLLASVIPVVHLRGAGVASEIKTSGGLFFVWTLFALGAIGIFSAILSVHGMLEHRAKAAKP